MPMDIKIHRVRESARYIAKSRNQFITARRQADADLIGMDPPSGHPEPGQGRHQV
jgi:hypothetical protein